MIGRMRTACAPGACRTAIESTDLAHLRKILEPDPAQGRPTDYLVDTQMMAMFGSARSAPSTSSPAFYPIRFHATACHSHAIVRLDRRSSTIDRIAVRIVGGLKLTMRFLSHLDTMRPRRRIGRGRRLQCAISPDMRRKKPLSSPPQQSHASPSFPDRMAATASFGHGFTVNSNVPWVWCVSTETACQWTV